MVNFQTLRGALQVYITAHGVHKNDLALAASHLDIGIYGLYFHTGGRRYLQTQVRFIDIPVVPLVANPDRDAI